MYVPRLCVAMLRLLQFRSEDDALFGMFDGGRNDEVPKLLVASLPALLREQMEKHTTPAKYMKYTMLAAHRSELVTP